MKSVVNEKEYSVAFSEKLEYIAVGGGQCVYRLTVTKKKNSSRAKPVTKEMEGVCSEKSISAYLKGKNDGIANSNNIYVIDSDVMEDIRLNGFQTEGFKIDEIVNRPFSRMQSGSAKKSDVYRVDWGGHMIFDLEDRPMPIAVRFGYLSGNMDDAHYDMRKAIAILSRRKDVLIDSGKKDIPYYNSSSRKNCEIVFLWRPSKAQYRKMWEVCLSHGAQYPSTRMHEAIFEADLLGLRKGGAAKYDSYYKSDEYIDD